MRVADFLIKVAYAFFLAAIGADLVRIAKALEAMSR